MKHKEHTGGSIRLIPETVEEAGFLYWLASRFSGESVSLYFDTWTDVGGTGKIPGLQISVTERE
jgi:hypothetical protein